MTMISEMSEKMMSNLKELYYSVHFTRILILMKFTLIEYLYYSFIIYIDVRKFTYLSVILIFYHAAVAYFLVVKV